MKLILRIVETLVFYLALLKKVLKSSSHGTNFPNISNSIDNLYIRTSLLSESITSGKRSDVLYTFSTNKKRDLCRLKFNQ